MKVVIRAGGTGTRLWPMSRTGHPKQFQALAGSKSMIRTTYERVAPVLGKAADLFVSVNKTQKRSAAKSIPELLKSNMIIEADTRNTGPAMCLEVAFLMAKVDPNEVIATLPSDDYISDPEAFCELLFTTEKFIQKHPDHILTPAVKPDYPDTGYSYLKAGKNLHKKGQEAIYEVAQVVEKPDADYCEELIKSGVYYCHTGMYLWQLKHIAALFERLQPGMYEICQEVAQLLISAKANGRAAKLYSQLEKISIESAITNKTEKIAMSVSNRIGWSDLGKWHVIKRILPADANDNLTKGRVLANRASRSLIYSTVKDKLIVANDIKDLAIIDTGDALFISSLKNSADVKKAVDMIKEKGWNRYL